MKYILMILFAAAWGVICAKTLTPIGGIVGALIGGALIGYTGEKYLI